MKKVYFELPPMDKDPVNLFLRKHITVLNTELSRLAEGIKKETDKIRVEANAASSRQDSASVELVRVGGRLDAIEAELEAIHKAIDDIRLQIAQLYSQIG